MTMQLIRTATVGVGGAASITFTGIPQDATDLLILISARTSATGGADSSFISFNGVTTSFIGFQLVTNDATFSANQNNRIAGYVTMASNTANTFSNSYLYITNYATSNLKNYFVDSAVVGNASTQVVGNANGYWNNTAAITSITLTPNTLSFIENSTASLYKITKGSDGIVVVT